MIDPLPEPENLFVRNWHTCPKVIKAHREALDRVVDLAADEPYEGDDEEFGVLIVGGGSYWPGSVLCARMLREYGYQGPIEIWHGHQYSEEPIDPKLAEGLGIRTVNARAVMAVTQPRRMEGFASKVHAIRHCRFRRLFFFDADAYPVAPIEPIVAATRGKGFCYWIDFPWMARNVKFHAVCEEVRHVPPVQGGHLLIDRKKCWQAIVIADWICQHSDFYYHYLFADQDAMRVALILTDTEFLTLGQVRWHRVAIICDYQGRPVVVHRVRSKPFFPEEVGNFRQAFQFCPGLPEEERAYAHFLDLVRLRGEPDLRQIFRSAYQAHVWNHEESVDFRPVGHTLQYIELVAMVARLIGARAIVDLGCGPGWITQEIARRTGCKVTGVDVVDIWERSEWAELKNDTPELDFRVQDIRDVESIPRADLVLCKDVLHHWPSDAVENWLKAFCKRATWRLLMLTNDRQFLCQDTFYGGYRGLDPSRNPLREHGPWLQFNYAHKAVLVKIADHLDLRAAFA